MFRMPTDAEARTITRGQAHWIAVSCNISGFVFQHVHEARETTRSQE